LVPFGLYIPCLETSALYALGPGAYVLGYVIGLMGLSIT
jgi:hypothetical protein